MDLMKRRQNFTEKSLRYFDYLTKEFGYTFKGKEQSDWTDRLIYENSAVDRMVIISNEYHPVDYGFEIQWFKPTVSKNHSDREFQICVLKENQDDSQEYLSGVADQVRNQFEGIIKGENWILTN
jgi:hypothetical protein